MAEAPVPSAAAPAFEKLVRFDGACCFCDRGVRWLVERDPDGRLRFAPLQGGTAQVVRERHRLFGELDGCRFPSREERMRLLD